MSKVRDELAKTILSHLEPQVKDLSIADIYVRQAMLKLPSISESRMQVLSHVFMTNGNGLEFDDSGRIAESMADDVSLLTEMKIPDKPTWKDDDVWEAELELYKHREKYIDLYASGKLNENYHICSVYPASRDYNMLTKIALNPDAIHGDWIRAALQFCRWFLQGIKSVIYTTDPITPDKIADPRLKENFEIVTEAYALLKSVDPARDPDNMARIKALVEKAIEENS